MTTEEKIIFYIRESLIEKYGKNFIQLSDKAQNDLVYYKFCEMVKENNKNK